LSSLLDDLKQQIAKGQTVVIVGAGVSIGATRGQRCASWTGLLHDGVNRCVDLGRVPALMADTLHTQIDSSDLDFLLAAAEAISRKLGAPNDGEYRRWLRESVGMLSAENREVIEALNDLGVVLATTNYDDLIEEVTGLPAVTWMDDSKVERVLRGDERGILHLHGYWDRPESVVLGIRSYEQVLGNKHAQTMQQAVASLRAILFVGCGEGLGDPNFGSLLKWTGEVFASSEYRRFRLALESEREKVQQQHPNEQRLFVLPYGQKHDDLAEFLRGLKPERRDSEFPVGPPPPTPVVFRLPARPRCFGREEDLKAMVAELLADQPKPIPILGTAGIGKSTLTLAAMHDEQAAAKYGGRRYFIRCDGIKTRNSLVGEVARVIGLEPSPNIEPAVLYELASAPAILALDNAETPWEADMLPVEELFGELANVPKLALIASIRGNERPGGVRWREAFRLEKLELTAARETFLDIAGRNFETDDRLDDLLAAIDYVPLAIMLIAHASESEPNLENVWHRWQAEHTAMLKRAGGADKMTNIEVSYEFSLNSPRRTPEALRLLKLLAMLPSGLATRDLSLVMHRDGPAAASVLRKLGLVFDESERLRLLAPLREYVYAQKKPEPYDEQRLASHFIEIAEALGSKIGQEGGEEAIQQLTPEAFNIEEVLSLELKKRKPKKVIETTLTWSEFIKNTGIGSSRLLKQALIIAGNNNLLVFAAECSFQIGEIAFSRSDYGTAVAKYEEALSTFRLINNYFGEGKCIASLGSIAKSRSDYEMATGRYEEALQIFHRIGNSLGEANCIRNLGEVAHLRSDYETASTRHKEALQIYRQLGISVGEANCIVGLGDVANSRSDYEAAIERYGEALQIYRRIGSSFGVAKCSLRLGQISHFRSDYETATAKYEEALQTCRRIDNSSGEASCILSLGEVACSRSDYEMATIRYEEALHIYRRIGSPLGEANCILSLGDVANFRSDYEMASARYDKALQLYCKIGESAGEATCTRRLGDIAASRSDYEVAITKYEKALQIYRRIGEPLGEASCIQSLGDVAASRSDYETASARYEEALLAFRLIESHLGEANCFHGFGKISLSRSDYETASEQFDQALKIYKERSDLRSEAECLFDLGRLALAQEDQAAARSHFERALVLFQQVDNPLWLSKTHRRLAQLAGGEIEKKKHLETAESLQERLATIDLMLLLEEEMKSEEAAVPL